MESDGVEERVRRSENPLFGLLRVNQVRIVIVFIGLISALLPWFVWSPWGSNESVNLIDIMTNPNSDGLLVASLLLFIVGLFLCIFKDEVSILLGGPMIFVGFIGFFYWYVDNYDDAVGWGLGLYLAVIIGLVMIYASAKKFLEEMSYLD